MQILHVLDHSLPLHSGYSFRTINILKNQIKLGYLVSVVTSDKQGTCLKDREILDNINFYRTPILSETLVPIPIINQIASIYGLKKRLENVIKEFKPDIIHAHSPSLTVMAATQIAKKYSIPLIYEVRAFWEDAAVDQGTAKEQSLRYKLTRAIDTYLFQRIDSIVTICDGLKQDILERGINPQKITVVHNAVDTNTVNDDLSNAIDLKRALKLENDIILGFIGSFYQYEGLIFLLDAFKNSLKRFSNLKLILAGGGPEESYITQQIASLNLKSKVILLGRVDHSQIATLYKVIDICVYPRHKIRLTDIVTPLKPLEAMAHQCSVLASDVGGHLELIEDKVTGLLFQAGSKKDFILKLEDLIQNPQLKQKMITNAKAFIDKERTWQSNIIKYQKLYESLKS